MSILTLLGGALIMAGLAYPGFAKASGWPIGSAGGGTLWVIWFALGALAYLAGMFSLWHWWGIIAAVPAAFAGGLMLTVAMKRHIQIIAYLGPILANIWHLSR